MPALDRVKPINRARLLALLAAMAMASGCGPPGVFSSAGGRVVDDPSAAATTVSTPGDRIPVVGGGAQTGAALSTASRQPQPGPSAGSSLTPSHSRLGCPVLVANPIGCPLPGPRPLRPPVALPRIILCGTALTVCGSGFRPEERLVLLVIGRIGTIGIPVHTGANGTILVVVPSSVCSVTPLMIMIRGDRGEGSNAIPVPAFACRMR